MIFDHEPGQDSVAATGVWDFATGYQASQEAREAQDSARADRKKHSEELAEKERTYRVALAKEILRLHADEGVNSWSACENIARGQEDVAQLRYERDLARGVAESSEERAWRHQADRKDVGRMIEWSRAANPSGA